MHHKERTKIKAVSVRGAVCFGGLSAVMPILHSLCISLPHPQSKKEKKEKKKQSKGSESGSERDDPGLLALKAKAEVAAAEVAKKRKLSPSPERS